MNYFRRKRSVNWSRILGRTAPNESVHFPVIPERERIEEHLVQFHHLRDTAANVFECYKTLYFKQ